MNNQIQVFENKEIGKVRVMEIYGQPWFVGKDVAKSLGYERPTKAIQDHVDEEDRDAVPIQDSIGRLQKTPIINESGMYSLILSSKLPTARVFKRWVTFDILPSIRRHGAYITDETLRHMRESEAFAKDLIQRLSDERAKSSALLNKVERLAPKARYYDVILQCEGAVQVSVIAKDYGMSASGFNKLLHGLGVQYKIGETWLLYAKYMNEGYTVTRTYHAGDKVSKIHTYWTQRGRCFLYDLLKWYGILPLAEKINCALIGGDGNIC